VTHGNEDVKKVFFSSLEGYEKLRLEGLNEPMMIKSFKEYYNDYHTTKSEHKTLFSEILKNILFEKETVLMPNLSTVGGQYKIDFKIKDIFFEIDGEQHFRTTSKWAANGRVRIRDNEKNTYCAENNLTLIRIPYHKSTHSPKIIKHIENILKIEGTDSIQNYCSLNGLLYITNKNIYENNYYTINDAIYQNRD
jgi:hypothetical protein